MTETKDRREQLSVPMPRELRRAADTPFKATASTGVTTLYCNAQGFTAN
jgi:hypothetical protein